MVGARVRSERRGGCHASVLRSQCGHLADERVAALAWAWRGSLTSTVGRSRRRTSSAASAVPTAVTLTPRCARSIALTTSSMADASATNSTRTPSSRNCSSRLIGELRC